jgi:hypothetical protein
MVGGNSPVGSMYDLPMGLLEVRCEHAPPPRVQGHQALELAMDFYDANCIGCPYRDGSGELPSLATVPGKRAAEKAAREAAAQQAADDRARRHELRSRWPGGMTSARLDRGREAVVWPGRGEFFKLPNGQRWRPSPGRRNAGA